MKPAQPSNSSSGGQALGAPPEIIELVRRFEEQAETYTSQNYNETQVRREFVDPFFKALGWDVDNSSGFGEAYKDVIHEDAVRVERATKAPDYSFRVGGTRKFFLEAKRPSINLKDDPDPAFQLRRYGWSAKLPLSILTDFEELAVYDCRVRPHQSDKASAGRLFYFRYKEYESRWDEIAGIFSKEAVLKGSFDRFAEKGGKRGTAAVDDAFLEQIDEWRKELAQNLALRNQQLSQRDLNYAVQVTLDRIIFLRICEARGIEDYGKLQSNTNGANVYARLCESFRQADERYNSGLFHFKKEQGRSGDSDPLTLHLQIDDKVLRDIVEGLYYPQSPYELSVLPADILGSVYERFLGKVIRLTDGHRAKIEEKPEVKKAGGVFYTPAYIVDYIVENTVGKLLEGKTPKQAASLRIVDPACGSGSFLIGAYQRLLDWHLTWYKDDGPEKWSRGKEPALYASKGGEWRLTAGVRKKILLNNIYGVDIDAQAVEVTKLSLLLKVLEGETGDTLANQLRLFQERALPDLENNIQCGNSLIDHDYFDDDLIADVEGRRAVNAFSWSKAFPDIFRKGGFDAVIGNPPYGAELSAKERKHLAEKFDHGSTDSAALMMVQAQRLLAPKGLNAFIVPKPYAYSSTWEGVRKAFIGGTEAVVDVGKVWKEVKLEQLIYVFRKSVRTGTYRSSVRVKTAFRDLAEVSKGDCEKFGLLLNGISAEELALGNKLCSSGVLLSSVSKNTRGAMLQAQVSDVRTKKAVIGGKQIQPYQIVGQKGYLSASARVPENGSVVGNSVLAQNIIAHVEKPQDHIKIIAALGPSGSDSGLVILDTVNQLVVDASVSNKLILGFLSSALINWYVYRFIFAKAIRTMHFDGPVTGRIPLPADLSSQACAKVISSVERMLELQQLKGRTKSPLENRELEGQIGHTQDQIDAWVCKAFGLGDEESKLTVLKAVG